MIVINVIKLCILHCSGAKINLNLSYNYKRRKETKNERILDTYVEQ